MLICGKKVSTSKSLSHRLVHSRYQLRTQTAVPSPEACREQHTMPPQGACLPRTPSMVLRTPSWFCSGFSSFSLFPSLTPRGYPQSSANCSLERSLHIHSFTYHPHTNPKYKPAPRTPITSIWPRHFKCFIGFQSPHKNPALSLKCGRHVP